MAGTPSSIEPVLSDEEPGTGSAAGCLFLDEQRRVLLVKPAYKEPWEIPGGGVERGESPREACRRELREELGIDLDPGPMLCVDHRPATADGRPDALRFVFDGGIISASDAEAFRLDPSELLGWRFVDQRDLDDYVVPVLARRLRSAMTTRGATYLEDGLPPTVADGAQVITHPSPEIPRGLVAKIVGRRGRLHAFETIDPARTALVVIDFDEASCQRDQRSRSAIEKTNAVASALRGHGGTVAFVTSIIADANDLADRLGDELASTYAADGRPGAAGTRLAPQLDVRAGDIRAVKLGTSAFFPGRCDLSDQLKARSVESLLIAGLVTNVCCESSARDACELGYRVTMISDANIGHDWGLHEATLATFFRFFGDVRPASDVIGLLRR